jgi:hypothetical protein
MMHIFLPIQTAGITHTSTGLMAIQLPLLKLLMQQHVDFLAAAALLSKYTL